MKNLLAVAVTGALLGSGTASASVSDAEFAELKAQFAAMAQRLNTLETENNKLREQTSSTVSELAVAKDDLAVVKKQAADSSWSEKLSVKGDFRYRYEGIDVEGADYRDRNRIRARTEMVAKLPNDVDVGFGLATGNDDPVSSNQTLGAGNSSKQINVDLAYAKWRPMDGMFIDAGKYKNPLFSPNKNAMLWDGDWRPEGVDFGWSDEHLFVTGLVSFLESDSKSKNEAAAWGVQGGLKFGIGDASLTTALGYFDIPVKGKEAYYDGKFFGNSNANGVYLYDYQLVEASAEFVMSVFDMPLSLYGDYVENQDPSDYNTGWLAGVSLGKTKGAGTWELGYQYQDLEADAAFGLVTDSDFAGGGTDGKGSKITGAYGINDQWSLGLTWFVKNEAGEKAFKDEGGALSYDRIQLDTMFKY